MSDLREKILAKVVEPLRKALIEHDLTEDNVVKIFASILNDEKARPADRLRAIEIYSKWAALAAPETKVIDLKGVSIGVKEPEDTDI